MMEVGPKETRLLGPGEMPPFFDDVLMATATGLGEDGSTTHVILVQFLAKDHEGNIKKLDVSVYMDDFARFLAKQQHMWEMISFLAKIKETREKYS